MFIFFFETEPWLIGGQNLIDWTYRKAGDNEHRAVHPKVAPTVSIYSLGRDRILSRCSASTDLMCSVAVLQMERRHHRPRNLLAVSPTSNRGLEA